MVDPRPGTDSAQDADRWVNLTPARDKLLSLFREILEDPGYGELRVDVKALRNGQMEVVISCGKKYRFVLKPATGKTK
ncbi:MAG: hypothetical protein V1701_03750 [Planctomycetota bacterium]